MRARVAGAPGAAWRSRRPRPRRRRPTSRRAACSRTAAPTGAGQAQAGARQLQHHRLGLPEHRVGGRRAARDRPLPPGGRERRRQGARRLRAGGQALPAERRRARRLLLPRPAHPEPRHDARRARRRAGPVRARAALYPRSDWVPRALSRTGARPPQGRPARGGGRGSAAASRSSTRRATRPPAAQFEIGHALALLGEPRPAMEEFQQVRNRFPQSEWAGRALDRITALYRLHGAAQAGFAPDPAFAVGAGDVLKDVRALLMTPTGTLWIASEKVQERRARSTPTASWAPASARRTCAASALSPTRRGDPGVAQLAVRIGARGHPDLRDPAREAGRRPSRSRRSRRPRSLPGGVVLVADEKRKHVLPLRRARASTRAPFPDARRSARSPGCCSTARAASCCSTGTRRRCASSTRRASCCARVGPGRPRAAQPVDVAVDPFRNLYVADEEAGRARLLPAGPAR